MASAAGSILTAFTLTLHLLTWQQVSNFMPDAAGSLIALTPTLAMFT